MRRKKAVDWLQTRQGTIFKGVVALLLAYVLGSRALHTGSYWQYLGTIILLVWGTKRTYHGLLNKLT